jgi:predicted transcriptional regulator
MAERYIMFDLNDSRSYRIAEVMSNKTCKKILNLIAENELSESEIASKLNLPLNTVDYNIKNLVEAGMIEPAKNVLWSIKGRRVVKYRVSNKKIVISPKSMFKGVIPAVLITGIAAYVIKMITTNNFIASSDKLANVAPSVAQGVVENSVQATTAGASVASEMIRSVPYVHYGSSGVMSAPIWAWFTLGGLTALLIYIILKTIDERRWKYG